LLHERAKVAVPLGQVKLRATNVTANKGVVSVCSASQQTAFYHCALLHERAKVAVPLGQVKLHRTAEVSAAGLAATRAPGPVEGHQRAKVAVPLGQVKLHTKAATAE
jgi:hypothetical protein